MKECRKYVSPNTGEVLQEKVLEDFCKSKEGFRVRAALPRTYNTMAYNEVSECSSYGEALKTAVGYMSNSRVYVINIDNKETGVTQYISDSRWR